VSGISFGDKINYGQNISPNFIIIIIKLKKKFEFDFFQKVISLLFFILKKILNNFE